MKISVRNLEPTKVKLTVTVEPEELNPYLDAARKEIAKQVNVPGFRKGHVPGKIIDQRIGFAAVAGEAVNDAVPELYSKALDEKKIRPMAQPEFDVQDFARAYAVLAAQRATKILGIFARLDRRDGKPGYLAHLPRIEGYLRRNLAHPALERLRLWHERHLPALAPEPADPAEDMAAES